MVIIMKRKSFFIGLLLPILFLPSCNSKKVIETYDSYVDVLPTKMDDGVILHAFCWKYNDILETLPEIKDAGYRIIQTSPVTQPKKNGVKWDFFYQPVSYSISDKSPLGTKAELEKLCQEAHKLGISIIVDIVFNHMATTGNTDSDGFMEVDPEINEYEPYIYENRSVMFHRIKNPSGSGTVTMTYSGLPDLNTSNEYIQQRSYELLKECIDVGVDGFRFDAAKHIETPDDPNYSSDFWPNTLGEAKKYYKGKTGNDLFAYGEILNGLDGGRDDVSIYTKYMKITDNTYINGVKQGVFGQRDAKYIVDASYGKKTSAENLITWVESHDTYVTDSSPLKDNFVARVWSVIAARRGTNPLFLARTNTNKDVAKIGSYSFDNELVAVSNRFHNRFVDAEEYQSNQKDFYVLERYSENDRGALVIDINGKGTGTVKFKNLVDGTYWDSITGSLVVIKGGKANFTFDSSRMCILTKTKKMPRPEILIEYYDGTTQRGEVTTFGKNLEVTLTVSNASGASYSINDGEPIPFENTIKVVIGDDIKGGETITLSVTASNTDYSKTRTRQYKKYELIDGYFNVLNLNPSYIEDYSIYYWAWGNNSKGQWFDNYKIENGVLLIVFSNTTFTGFLLATFPKDYKITDLTAWDNNVISQTSDITISEGFYDASAF